MHDPKSTSYGDEAAEKLGINTKRVFKTLIVQMSTGDLAVGVVPVSNSLNLKAIASALKVKSVTMADTQKAQRVTGYVLGGISPLGQKKALPTIIDLSAKSIETIYVSAGRRGLEIQLSTADLAFLCKAQFAEIAS